MEERGLCTLPVSRCLTVGLWGAATRRGAGAWDGHRVGHNSGDWGWRSTRISEVGIVELSRGSAWLRDGRSHLGKHVVGQDESHHGGHYWAGGKPRRIWNR